MNATINQTLFDFSEKAGETFNYYMNETVTLFNTHKPQAFEQATEKAYELFKNLGPMRVLGITFFSSLFASAFFFVEAFDNNPELSKCKRATTLVASFALFAIGVYAAVQINDRLVQQI